MAIPEITRCNRTAVLLAVHATVLLGYSPARTADDITLLVKLNPSGAVEESNWKGRTGRTEFDRIVARSDVSDVTQIFPPSQVPARLQSIAKELQLSSYASVRVRSTDSKAVRDQLSQSPDVESIELSGEMRIAGLNLTPNDPYFATHQYPLRNTGAEPPYDPGTSGADAEMEAAWGITTGDTTVTYAIIDTGVDIFHPEFTDRMWINYLEDDDGFDTDSNGYVDDFYGYDFANNDGLPLDDHQHGTHCAGIAGATGNNGIGIAGMNWNCKIMAVKVLDAQGSGTFTAIAQGVYYATNMGADIINLSLGGPSSSGVLQAAVNYALGAGVIVVAAMGNDDGGELFFPAAYDGVISVGATDSRDRRAKGDLCPFEVIGSNYGSWIDVCAAGDVVWSTFPPAAGNYGPYCLTSMAGPHVVGLASLILTLRPGMSADSVNYYITRGAEDEVGLPTEDTPGFDIYHGWGRINGRITLQALAFEFEPDVIVPGSQSVTELDNLSFTVYAFDSNLTPPLLTASTLPNSSLTPQGEGEWLFSYTPGSTDAGVHQIEFIAVDTDGNADTGIVEVTVLDGCACDCHGNPVCDAAICDVLDVVSAVTVAFRNGAALPDPNSGCPYEMTDVDCSTFTDVIDVVKIVNVAFRNGNPATEFCNPCP